MRLTVASGNEYGAVQLGDFGVADFMAHGRRGHTLEYAAPELLAGEARSPATDVWAAAVLLYELLCNEMPFGTRAEMAEEDVAERIGAGAFPDPLGRRPYLPRRFRAFFSGAFETDAAQRAVTTAEGMKLRSPTSRSGASGSDSAIPPQSRCGRG